ncbi:hypothetical protein P7C70_g2070, partial [Phenoliferia sp. Uapishka_3]
MFSSAFATLTVAFALFTSTQAAAVDRRRTVIPTELFVGNSSNSLPYYTKQYSGIATYFDGAPSALACGDIYNNTETEKFVALCFTLFDSAPGSTATTLLNPNKSPVCGEYVDSKKDISGGWMTDSHNTTAYVTVGGDGAMSCVGTPGVQCHIPRTIAVTYGSKEVTGIPIADRMARTNCAAGDLDLSQNIFMSLGDSLTAGILHGISWKFE